MGIRYKIGKLIRRETYPSLNLTLKYLRSWGYRPENAVDIGAYVGQWTISFKKIFPETHVLMIEPLESKKGDLEQVCSDFHQSVFYEFALLGPQKGTEVDFMQMETGSSVFEESSPYERTPTKMVQTTFDDLIETSRPDWQKIDFVKIDVQGYELEVLKGASNRIREVEFILLESSLIPVNQGCPLIAETIAFMKERGFRLFDICAQIRRTDGALWQTDLLFINESSQYLPRAELTKDNWY